MSDVDPGRRPGTVDARARTSSELATRIVSAVVLASAAVGTAWLGGVLFDLFWLAAALLVLWEWMGLVGARLPVAAVPGAVALVAAAGVCQAGRTGAAMAALAVGSAVTAALARPGRRVVAALGPLYAAALVVPLILLRRSDLDGVAIVVWLFAVVWGTDTFAYFGGRAIGGPRLAPRFSPSKTWSGFAVGIASGALLGVLVAPRHDCVACLVVAGLLAGAVAQAGDLLESSLKRRFGAKDSGSLIPGHGGVMDRLDGFIAASLLAAAVGLWRFGPAGAGAGLLQW